MLAADTAYGTGKFLHWVIGAGITPHIPVWDMSKREEGILSRADFTFDREHNLYICPQGKFLRTTGTVHDRRTILYRASTRDCGPCPLKPKCTPNMTFRKIPRDVHEDARDATRAWMGTPEFAKSRNERKKVEMRFAHLKTHHGFERMRLRGFSGARDEFPPRCHRAELEDPCQPYLAAVAEHADCMHRLSASGVQRQGALDARAKLAGPAGKEDEERDEKRLSKADRTARPTSSATFSTLSTHGRHRSVGSPPESLPNLPGRWSRQK